MRKSLRIQPQSRSKPLTPSLEEQLRIIGALLKLKHFDAIWFSKGTLTVRRFRDHFEVPEYLSWERAAQMVETGLMVERKPPTSLKSSEKTGSTAL